MIDKIINDKKPMNYVFEANGAAFTLMEGERCFSYFPLRQISLLKMQHTHSWYEMFYIEEGILHAFVGDKAFDLKKGDLFIVAPGVEHYTAIDEAEGAARFCFNFVFCGKKESKLVAEMKKLLAFSDCAVFTGDGACHTQVRLLADAMRRGESHAAGCYLLSLLLAVASLTGEGEARRTEDYGVFDDNENNRIYMIESICQKYFNEKKFSICLLAEELHLSERQVERIIKRQYGCSFRDLINDLRMREAQALLRAGRAVSVVAEAVGYASLSAFHRAFRLYCGCSPREYVVQKKTSIAN